MGLLVSSQNYSSFIMHLFICAQGVLRCHITGLKELVHFSKEPNAILKNFHIGRLWLKITIYTRLSESENYLKKRVLNSNSNKYW